MPSILFIAPADLGETVLATGALAFALTREPAASVTVVCRPEAMPLFRATPRLATLHGWEGRDGFSLWVSMAWRVARKPFDLILDFDGSPAGFAVHGRRRLVARRARALVHRLEEWSALIGAEAPLAPAIWLDARARDAAAAALPEAGPVLALAPGADASAKRWPAERFAAIARRLVGGPLGGARVVLLGDGGDCDVARAIASSLDADGVAALDLAGELDLLAQAALLQRATLFVGNDSALMHLAAAMKAPTLGLFGPSDERLRGPHGARSRALRGRPYEDIMGLAQGALDGQSLMEDVSVDAVEAAALALLHAGGLQ